ncbi:MAG: lysophospholipid acyltransferase family protein [Candidatus Omnitrophica bacterium]|nr:lysophospholipid acyltransferase family protein [Candidatus Omnitrophota bacterium]
MFFYALYWIGSWGTLLLPRSVSYWIACRLADFWCLWCAKDREGVRHNLEQILGTREVSEAQVREVFRNFGKYLVDFFRFQRLSPEKMRQQVTIEGLDWMREVLRSGRGAIGLTAHLGNYELAGAVLALSGLPVNAVVLTHRNPRVNAFFERQRGRVGVRGIPLTQAGRRSFFESALSVLRNNQILALVGDRDFSNHGLKLPFFGKWLDVPTGPAAFYLRTRAPIVPGFLVREPGGRYRFILERPITVPPDLKREEAVRQISQACLEVMERYIRRYPTQWYIFHDFWTPGPSVIL